MNPEEKIVERLTAVYESFGYSRYKMNKFEEYDLYANNKDLLATEGIITFTDTNGKLMALKPDVTLSIIRNTMPAAGKVSKLFYNENVYRISKASRTYREIMQTGLECIGDTDDLCVLEVVALAAKSLKALNEDSVLCISVPELIPGVLRAVGLDNTALAKGLDLAEKKNLHELAQLLDDAGCKAGETEKVLNIAVLTGDCRTVLASLAELGTDPALTSQLEMICSGAELLGIDGMLRADLTMECGTRYYNGIVMKGYVEGISVPVLSGGRYDALAGRMGKKCGAIGFAVYMDVLERLKGISDVDVPDVLILYDESVPVSVVMKKAQSIRQAGKKASVLRYIPEGNACNRVIDLRKGGKA